MGLFIKILEIDNIRTNGVYPDGTQRVVKKFNIIKWEWVKYKQVAKIKSFTDGDGVIYDNIWNNIKIIKNMNGYLGETIKEQKDTPFKDYTDKDWCLYFIERYGQIDGEHHKSWVMDQVVQILKGTKIIIKKAEWDNGQSEYRINLEYRPSEAYNQWVIDMKNGGGGSMIYDYDSGIAP